MIKPRVHFIGIGGIGTSALARWFLSNGYNVSGSDVFSSEITKDLRTRGIKIFIGHKAKNVSQKVDLVIFSAAVPKDNPERRQAVKLGIPVKSYAETVGSLTRQYKTLAVAGAHGKSTTTALLSLVLMKAGFDPTVIIGTKLKKFGNSNFRPARRIGGNGKGDYLVLEADEYNQSFLNHSPFAAIILNIDAEHLDFYKNLTGVKNAFLKFINNVQRNGILVLNQDDKNLFSLKNKIQKIAKKSNLKVYWYSRRSRMFTKLNRISEISGEPSNVHRDALLGEHNVYNALAAYTLAKVLSIKDKDIFNVISQYRGAWRRMEYRGDLVLSRKYQLLGKKRRSLILTTNYKIPVYDDYAHHPTEIKACLSGIAQKWPKMGLICVFEPHQAKRLSLLFKQFIRAFDDANALVLLPVYQVAGRESIKKLSHNINSKKLAQAIQKRMDRKSEIGNWKLRKVVYLPSPRNLHNVLEKIIRDLQHSHTFAHSHYVIVMMGAGDIYKLTDSLLK